MNNFNQILNIISEIKTQGSYKNFENYHVPEHWIGDHKIGIVSKNAIDFFIEKMEQIIELSKEKTAVQTHNNSVIYGMFIRYTCAFDHDRDREVSKSPLSNGMRETGTFLKAIALLPYLRSLGINIIYLLPITKIGVDGKKGDLGSPYAVKNPYELDENLAEPFLNVSIENQFRAFVEAAHSLKMQVVTELVLRTASIDSDLALDHPEWFYWIKEETKSRKKDSFDENSFGPPMFNDMELSFIKQKISSNDLANLTQPHKKYRELFTLPPKAVSKKDDRLIGKLDDGSYSKIAGAFADWPPDDNQPPWDDVTYLKLYDHPDFNYIAYNTVRMYDKSLSKEANRQDDLWNAIEGIIPYYIKKYDIDGAMIDMGHAIPNELRMNVISKARELKDNFIFWEENFEITSKSKANGFDASLGYLCFIEHDSYQMNKFLNMLSNEDVGSNYFASPDTHNTPRAASKFKNLRYSQITYLMNSMLSGLTFINSGFELYESMPINTGLGFVDAELKKYPDLLLPLFSSVSMNWENSNTLIHLIRSANEIKRQYIDNDNKTKIINLEQKGKYLCFLRETKNKNQYVLTFVSYNIENPESINIKLPFMIKDFQELIGNVTYRPKKASLILNVEEYSYFCGLVTVEKNHA